MKKGDYKAGALVIECLQSDCGEQREMSDAGAEQNTIQEGWGVDNGRWLCPDHLAARDAGAIEKAKVALERKAKAKAADKPEPSPELAVRVGELVGKSEGEE